MTNTNKKLRVWWIPQLGVIKTFYVDVTSPEEGWKLLQTLAAYDLYQLQQNVKPDFCNAGGLEYYNEETGEWEDWYDDDFYDDINNFVENLETVDHEKAMKLQEWRDKLFMDNMDNTGNY